MLLVKKNAIFFHYLFSTKARLEIRFSNVLDRKETFFDYQTIFFESLKNCSFPKGLTHDFGQKRPIFSLFVFDSVFD